jgi:putative sigma-54 modulation protein
MVMKEVLTYCFIPHTLRNDKLLPYVLDFCYTSDITLTTMNCTIKATNIDLTDALREYVNKRVDSLSKYVQGEKNEVTAAVEIGTTTRHHHSGEIFRAEIHVRIGGKTFRSVAEKDDLYAAIDEVREELMREITSDRDRERTLFRRGGQAVKDALRGFGKFFGSKD